MNKGFISNRDEVVFARLSPPPHHSISWPCVSGRELLRRAGVLVIGDGANNLFFMSHVLAVHS